jgi:hypothetical protein
MNLATLQREWSDNAVSNTLYFRPKWVLVEIVGKDERGKIAQYLTEAGTKPGAPITWGYPELVVAKKLKIVHTEFGDKVYKYDPAHEEHDVEPVLSMLAPVVKSVSMLPHTAKGVYKQMPEEGITKAEYEARLAAIKPIDWSRLRGSDGMDEKFCQGERCEVQQQ